METTKPAVRSPEDEQLAKELVERSRDEGVDLVGPGGLLTELNKNVLEAGLEAEVSEHLGYDKHDPVGRNSGRCRTPATSGTGLLSVPGGESFQSGPSLLAFRSQSGRSVTDHDDYIEEATGQPMFSIRSLDLAGDDGSPFFCSEGSGWVLCLDADWFDSKDCVHLLPDSVRQIDGGM